MNVLVTIPNGPIKDTFLPSDVRQEIQSLGSVVWRLQ
jgi:hypothetical protein